MRKFRFLIVPALLLAAIQGAHAQEAATASSSSIEPINVVWTLIAAFLVFFMQAGFCHGGDGFYAGEKRR